MTTAPELPFPLLLRELAALDDAATEEAFPALHPTKAGPLPAREEEQVRVALALFHSRQYSHCRRFLAEVVEDGGRDPRLAALRVTCSALLSGQLRAGVRGCACLLLRHRDLPDLYCALAVLLLKSRRREEAHTVLRQGLRRAPGHPALEERLHEMGMRQPPLLPFLPRAHTVNRWAGLVRSRLLAG